MREISPDLAARIATAYGTLLNTRKKALRVAVGHDTRHGAAMLARAAAAGLMASGCDVIETGCASIGLFSLHLVEQKWDGGIMITGSHMSYDRIGVIPVLPDGAYAPARMTDRIERLMRRAPPPVQVRDLGRSLSCPPLLPAYIRNIEKTVNAPALRRCRYKILVDPANGTACRVAPELFQRLGCRVETLHGTEQPIPERPSEPRAHTVRTACAAVTKRGCDLGIALDIDADRVLFIDECGVPVSEDRMGAVFALRELKRGDTCVTPVNSSGLIEETCRRIGARLVTCRIGQPPTVEAIKKRRAGFAYEESGKYYFPKHCHFSDGLLAAVRLLGIMARERRTLSELVGAIPEYVQVKHTVPVRNGSAEKIMTRVRTLWTRQAAEQKVRDITLDGLKRVYADHSWLLIRRSGTEPVIRVFADAPGRARAEELVRTGERLVKQAKRGDMA